MTTMPALSASSSSAPSAASTVHKPAQPGVARAQALPLDALLSAAQHGPVIAADAGETLWLGGMGVRFLLDGARTGGRFSLVEHPIRPRALAAPVHTHAHEDEYSFVLEGQVGVQLGDQTFIAGPGALVVKPRGVPHAFWNAGDAPARVLELISPSGFEQYFADLAPVLPPAVPAPDFAGIAAVQARYGITFDPASIPALIERHGLNAG